MTTDTEVELISMTYAATMFQVQEVPAKEVPLMDAMTLAEKATGDRFDRQQARAERAFGFAERAEGSGIIRSSLDTLTTHIKTSLLDLSSLSSASPRRPFLMIVRDLDPAVIALATLTGLLNAIAVTDAMVATQLRLGNLIAGELWAAELIEHAPKMAARAKRYARDYEGAKSYVERAKQKQKSFAERLAGFRYTKHWSTRSVLVAGNCMLEWALEALPDVFCLEVLTDGSSVPQVKPEAVETGLQAAEEVLNANPAWVPTSQLPAPWTGFNTGGWWDERTRLKAPLVRTHHPETRSIVKAALKAGTAQPHIVGLNALMNVPWKINTRVLEVVKWASAADVKIEGFPQRDEEPLPDPPCAFDEPTEEQLSYHRHCVGKVKAHNRALRSNRLMLAQDTVTAERLAGEEQFFTPFNCDWRGRLIPIPHFAFSRDDRVRALFLFANGLPIGEEGLWWLKVHVANSGDFNGISKRPFKERVAWVNENLAAIAQVADSPTAPTALDIWTKADSPFLFLAACMELADALATGPTFVTNLPVSFDGTCSGLQHLCAMTRAEEGSLVNLTPGSLPADVYQTVADHVKAQVEIDATAGNDLAKLFLDYGITRKLVKRNVMTYFYSAKVLGMGEQQMDDLMKPLSTEVLLGKRPSHPFAHPDDTFTNTDDDTTFTRPGFTAARYIAAKIRDAIEKVISRPALAMKFLKSLSNALAHEGKPLAWTTPSGMPVSNRYHELNITRVSLYLSNKRYQLIVADGFQKKLDKRGAARGVAPNFVHSMDAAHLFLTVNACVREGITSIATVHDSFGCLAPQATRFNAIIREAFVGMYTSHDVLNEVYEAAKASLDNIPKGFPEPPAKGSLNIKDVLNAPFTFA